MTEILPFLMLPVAFVLMFLGVQVAFSMMITAVLFGLLIFNDRVIFQFIEKIEDISSNFVFAAIPLFVFMGAILEKSGIADKLFEAIHIWTRRLPGGLAIATITMCIIFAASSGVIGATESVVGLLTNHVTLQIRQKPYFRINLRWWIAWDDYSAIGCGGCDGPVSKRFRG